MKTKPGLVIGQLSFVFAAAPAVLATACGGTQTAPMVVAPEPEVAPVVALSPIEELNRRAAAGEVVETLHGVEVRDPFRSLETESPLTDEWISWQTARTREALTQAERQGMRAELEALLRIGTVSSPAVGGGSIFYLKRETPRAGAPEREQPALYVRTPGPRGGERLLVDPEDRALFGERAAIDWYFVSPRGRYVAIGISNQGDERSVLRVIETATGRVLDERIEHTKWTDVGWLHAEDGFYYRRYPREGEPNYDAANVDSYWPRVYFHTLGGDPAADPLVFSPAAGTDFASPIVSADDRYVTLNVFHGWSETDVHLFDRGARARGRVVAPDEAHPLVPVVTGEHHIYNARVENGALLVLTNDGAPRYRVMRAPLTNVSDRSTWQVLIGERPTSTIESWAMLGDGIALHEIDDVHSVVRLYGSDGAERGEIALPTRGAVSAIEGDAESGQLVVAFSGYTAAPTILSSLRPRRTAPRSFESVATVDAPVDLTTLEVSIDRVASADGTMIPVTRVHRRGLTPDGSVPVLIRAYGGFNISLLPQFERQALYWVQRGGVFAVANLRGGGEFGEDWHRAGNLGNKVHVFEDMEAVIRSFSSSGISRPDRIAITGGSNGGLLMGAMITRCPDAFGAVATYVGLYDMIRYHRFPPAELWISEYGSADDATQFEWLRAYSPYHLVREGVRYPSIFVETADHDTRVSWAHSTKFAARLQQAVGGASPDVWFFREQSVGHGAGTPVSALVDRYSRMYAFFEHALGMSE